MKRLEKLKLAPPSARDVERLNRWLFEWNLLEITETSDTDGEKPDLKQHTGLNSSNVSNIQLILECTAETDREIKAGQIRLMHPESDCNLVYIAVAAVETDGTIVCVPFGSISEPATPDELLSGRKQSVVQVYCIWNKRRLPYNAAANSWVADQLTQIELERLLRALAAYDSNQPLPPDLQHDSGPPLIHPMDPRREYRQKEKLRIDRVFEHANTSTDNIISYDTCTEPQEYLKAAEPTDDYDPGAT